MNNLRLKELRKSAGYTQKEFAEKINVPLNTYRNWEQGKHEPDTKMLITIASLLSTSIDYLSGFTDERVKSISEELNFLMDKLPNATEEQIQDIAKYAKFILEADE